MSLCCAVRCCAADSLVSCLISLSCVEFGKVARERERDVWVPGYGYGYGYGYGK